MPKPRANPVSTPEPHPSVLLMEGYYGGLSILQHSLWGVQEYYHLQLWLFCSDDNSFYRSCVRQLWWPGGATLRNKLFKIQHLFLNFPVIEENKWQQVTHLYSIKFEFYDWYKSIFNSLEKNRNRTTVWDVSNSKHSNCSEHSVTL